jgi:hypothetical protein
MASVRKWKEHTSTDSFAVKFDEITNAYKDDNEQKTQQLEEFLIEEAIKAGVVKAKTMRQSKNPNRWAKHLAPWFNEACKEAKREYRKHKRQYGKKHEKTRMAYRIFRRKCN